MRAWFAALSLVAGCDWFFQLEKVPRIPDAAPQPDAALYCWAPVVTDPNGDPDLDNEPSSDDNCPTIANAMQADEDGDCRGDACDKCAWRADIDPDGADTDTDGVPNACDPNPDLINSYFFDGFNDDPSTRWSGDPGWSASGGSYRHDTATGRTARFASSGNTGFGEVYTAMVIDDLAGDQPFMTGIWTFGYIDATSNPAGIRAGLARDAGDPKLWVRIERVDQGNVMRLGQQLVPANAVVPTSVRFSVGYTTTAISASLSLDSVTVTANASIVAGSGVVGLFSIDTLSSFPWFAHIY